MAKPGSKKSEKEKSEPVTMRIRIGEWECEAAGSRAFVEAKIDDFLRRAMSRGMVN